MLILFDLDGTILDSLDAWATAYRKAVHPKKLTDEEIVKDFFHSTPESLSRHGIKNHDEYHKSVIRFIKDNYHLITIETDAEEALERLEEMGHTLGILTSRSKEIATIHCPPQLLSKFSVIIDREDALPKPHPDGVLKACRDTGIPINQTILVGDHPIDAKCAENVGVAFLFYKPNDHIFRRHKELVHARSFSSFKELLDLISNLGNEF